MTDFSGQWTDVVFLQDWESAGEDAPEYGDRDAMAEYLTLWDYGDENDAAHIRTSAEWGRDDVITEHEVGRSNVPARDSLAWIRMAST